MYNDTQRNVVLKVEYRGREQKARTRQIKRETRGGCEQPGSNLDALAREQSSN